MSLIGYESACVKVASSDANPRPSIARIDVSDADATAFHITEDSFTFDEARRRDMTKLERNQIDFSTFMLYRLAEHWGKSVPDTYRILDKANAIDGYLIPCYDMLHTLGSEYLVNDLTDYVRERGICI